MADYPAAITSFATLVDYVDYVLASHQNARAAEIVAIETELGTDIAGNKTDLKTRLATSMDADGNIMVDIAMGEISYFSTTGTTVVIATVSDGSTNMVKAAPTTALSSDVMDFDNGGANNGRLRYTGATTRMFHTATTISIASSGANDMFVIGVAKNGTVIAASKILMKIATSGDTASSALHIMVSLATNDYIELYVGNITDADDLIVKTLNIFAMGILS